MHLDKLIDRLDYLLESINGLCLACLPLKEDFQDYQEVPVQLSGGRLLKQIFSFRVLYQDFDCVEEFFVGNAWVLNLLGQHVIQKVTTDVQQELSDTLGQKVAPAHLGA